MKTLKSLQITGLALVLSLSLLRLANAAATRPAKVIGTTINISTDPPSLLLVALAVDRSPSFAGYRLADTILVARICYAIANAGGGTIIMYGIGNRSDKSGLRCSLKPVPPMDASLVLSRQLALKREIKVLKAYNNQVIREFLKIVQEQILGPPAEKIRETDINGFFKKLDVLMSEPEYANYRRMALVYSDGKQCDGSTTANARYEFKRNPHFTLNLCGWKTPAPTTSVAIQQFEDCQGFAIYLENLNSLKSLSK
jgi:hypothetical protein